MCKVGAFVGGAIAGAAVALLLAPEKGEDMRMRIKDVLKKYGVLVTIVPTMSTISRQNLHLKSRRSDKAEQVSVGLRLDSGSIILLTSY